MKPLEGFMILDFSQLLAGPFASLRLADMGATVIKVERPGTGDSYRTNYGPALKFNGDNASYYFANRNKESVSLDLKNQEQREKLIPLIQSADAMLINFRADVTDRLGLDYESVKKINPTIVYGEITGYGQRGWCADYRAHSCGALGQGRGYEGRNRFSGLCRIGLSFGERHSGGWRISMQLGAACGSGR